MSLSDMLDAICRDNLDKLRTLVALRECSDAEALRNTLLHEAVVCNEKAMTELLLQIGSNPNSAVNARTPLDIAASYGDLEIIEILLNHGADINAKDPEGASPLHIAASFGNLEIIEMLLNHGADINAKDDDGYSPLMIVLENGVDDATQLLLERGARLFSDNEGRSPLHVAVTERSLNVAVTGCSLKITKMLLQNGTPVNGVITSGCEKGYTPLHCACSSPIANIDIIELLLSNEAGVNLKTGGGLTPLHIASQIGNVRVINLLLNFNADINARDNCSYTPLYLAIEYKQEDAALMLIKKGAKVDDEFRNGDTNTTLRLAIRRGLPSTVEEILTRCPDPQSEIEKSKKLFESLPEEMINILLKYCFYIEFFHTAIRKEYIQIIESILKDRLDLTANFNDIINSSLHIAVKSGGIEPVQVLIGHGADVNGKDETGRTPLLYAIQDLDVEITKLLISHGADVKIADDAFGKTALHIAASQDRGLYYALEIVKMLLASGADVNAATTTEKLTPLHVACQNSYSELVELFLNHNADVNLRDKNGKTALHFAASKCNDLMANSVNSQNIFVPSLTMEIFFSRNLNVVKLLLKFGADINIKNKDNSTPMDLLSPRYYGPMMEYEINNLILNHALALEAINLYDAKNLRSALSKFDSTVQINTEKHFENCKQEIEKLKFVNVPGYQLTSYALMTRSIHSLASYVKNEDLITHFASDDFTTEFPIYARIFEGRLRNALHRRPLIGDANEFFRHHFQLPYVCVDYILSCLSSDDLQNLNDAMLIATSLS